MLQMNFKSLLVGTMMAGMLGGCASQGDRVPGDPVEGFNRAMYTFNDKLDTYALKPVAKGYKFVLPNVVQTGVNNFFSNLGTLTSIVNDLFQFKLEKAMTDTGRFVINSTFGIGGLIDWASKDGIEYNKEDFGQTLGHWGWKNSSYLVLPFFGPGTVRDHGGFAVDTLFFDPIYYVDHVPTRNEVLVTKTISTRASYLPGSDLLDEAALDPYAFMRDAYLQRRENQIYDGNPPKENFDDEPSH
jgi:phospholipid-binding lipoprotein MlaA